MPVKIIKSNSDLVSPLITRIFNKSIGNSIFHENLEFADMLPVYKQDNQHKKGNYRPVSILPTLFKVFERCLYNQIYRSIDNIL